MVRRLLCGALLLFGVAGLTAAQGGPPAGAASQASATPASPEDVAGRAALQQLCSTCHEASHVEGDFRTPMAWDEVLNTMSSFGATGTDEQFALVRTYLLRTFGKVNVNSAGAGNLAPVLDVSPAVADALVKYRGENGAFKTIDELKKVPGIDGQKLDTRKNRVTF